MSTVDHHPTEAQKTAGNYRKDHISFQGIPITIENKKGSTRRGVAASGNSWSCTLPADYGYIKHTEGADGDQVDAYIGADKQSPLVIIVNQKDLRTGRFDEHKCMLGYNSERAAVEDYCRAFADGKGRARIASVEPMSIHAFKAWLKSGKTIKPASSSDIISRAMRVATLARRAA